VQLTKAPILCPDFSGGDVPAIVSVSPSISGSPGKIPTESKEYIVSKKGKTVMREQMSPHLSNC